MGLKQIERWVCEFEGVKVDGAEIRQEVLVAMEMGLSID